MSFQRPRQALLPVALTVLAVIIGGTTASMAQENHQLQATPDGPLQWRAYLWMLEPPRKDTRLLAAFRQLGITSVNVSGLADSTWEGENSLPFYVGFVAPKKVLQIPRREWEATRATADKHRHLQGSIRPHCLHDPTTLKTVLSHIDAVLQKSVPNRPVALSLGDEISLTLRGAPLDVCWSPEVEERFRSFAIRKYGSWEGARQHWGAEEGDSSCFLTAEIRQREFIRSPARWNFSPWSDRRDFMDQTMADLLRTLVSRVSRKAPLVPCGITGLGAPDVFGGFDPTRIFKELSFAEPYDIGGSRELARSFMRKGSVTVRTLFKDQRDWRFNQHELWDYFLRGDAGAILWSAKEYFPQRRANRPSPWGLRLSTTLKKLAAQPASVYLNATPSQPQIAIVESHPSNRLHWMLDSREDGPSWVNRLPSYEKLNSTQNLVREAWQKVLEDMHFDYAHVSSKQLNESALSKFKVLILPRTIALSARQAKGISQFAKRGTVIADCQIGLFDESLRAHETPILDSLFGIERTSRQINLRGVEYRGPHDVRHPQWKIAEPGTQPTEDGSSLLTVAGQRVLVRRSYSDGAAAVYLNLLLIDYLKERFPFDDNHEILSELRGVIRSAGVSPIATVRYKTDLSPVPVRLFRKTTKSDSVLLAALCNFRMSGTAIPKDMLLNSQTADVEILMS